MSHLSITANLDIDPWVDLREQKLTHAVIDRIGMLPSGMASGKASVAIHALANDGSHVVLEISWAMFQMAHAGLRGTPTAQMEGL